MKKILALLLLISPLSAWSINGHDQGGGGSQIESAFRLRGYGLIVKVSQNIQANTLCSYSKLQNALDSSKIEIVDQLIDPNTGQPPATLNLDAYTVPGAIQLLKSSWQVLVGTETSPTIRGKSIDGLVLHEIYRATGSCDDDNFAISSKVISLIEGQGGASHFSKSYVFKYVYALSDSDKYYDIGSFDISSTDGSIPDDYILCDGKLVSGHKITCINTSGLVDTGTYISYEDRADKESNDVEQAQVLKIPDFPMDDDEMLNQWQVVSPQHPFIVVHDIQNGKWTWGIQ